MKCNKKITFNGWFLIAICLHSLAPTERRLGDDNLNVNLPTPAAQQQVFDQPLLALMHRLATNALATLHSHLMEL